MNEITAPQPGAPERVHRLLPLSTFGLFVLAGILLCLFGTLGFLWLADEVFEQELAWLDHGMLMWAYAEQSAGHHQLMLFFTALGERTVLGAAVASGCYVLLRNRHWIDAGGLLLAAIGGGLLNQLLKALYQRMRPDLFPSAFDLSSYSFPSGHTMGAITCYAMLAFVFARLLRRWDARALVCLAAGVLILGVGASRIYFGVHFPTDVLGGLIAGATWVVISILITQAAEWHVRRRTPEPQNRRTTEPPDATRNSV